MISINVNPAAARSGLNLGKSQEALAASLERLSSGRRIVDPSDDAGGLAVHMKMAAAQKRTEATAINLRNARSYLEVQDGAFQVADKVTSRMSELFALARDITKNKGDVENYDKEISVLKTQLISLATEKFNGVNLFEDAGLVVPTSEDGSQTTGLTSAAINSNPMMHMMINGFHTFDINGTKYIAQRGANGVDLNSTSGFTAYQIPGGVFSPVTLSLTNVSNGDPFDTANPDAVLDPTVYEVEVIGFPAAVDGSPSEATTSNLNQTATISRTSSAVLTNSSVFAQFIDLPDANGKTIQNTKLNYANSDEYSFLSQEALQEIADMRAQNGAEMSRINFAEDMLQINAVNLDAANSRIIDVDVAAESTQLARYQILQQAGTAMLAQANTSQQTLVRLLQS